MPTDMKKRASLIRHIETLLDRNPDSQPTVPFKLFFDGNDDDASFAVNTGNSVAGFRAVFEKLLARPDVSAVQFVIFENMDEDDESGGWPYSDTALIATSAELDEVADWFEEDFAPDDAPCDTETDDLADLPAIPEGHRWVTCWYD